MSKTKISIGQSELLRVLGENRPDMVLHVSDPEWGSGQVECYRWETMEARYRAPAALSDQVAALVKTGFLKFVRFDPPLLRRLFGARSQDVGYLTPLGWKAHRSPIEHLAEPLERDDYDRRYEPKGMWLRQIEGLPPRTE